MLPIWVYVFLAVLLVAIVYLLWRLRNCKCSLYETFETADATDADADADAETKDAKEDAKAIEETDTDGKEADVEVKKPEVKVMEEETDVESAPESKKAKASEKEKEKVAEPEIAKKTGESLMNYGEMKLFDSLRENAYSLQDIKRMIREGEITEKMIEKFLARVEKMEDRVSSGKRPEASIEGFSGSRYASAMFS